MIKRNAHRRSGALLAAAAMLVGLDAGPARGTHAWDAGVSAFAQRGFAGVRGVQMLPNAPYDGRFTFVRINYDTAPGGYWYRNQPAWSHGYPVAEENLMKIMNEVTYLGANDEQFNTLALDDPEVFRYPLIYLIEVSWWRMTDTEAAALGAYLNKGGFVIVD